MWNVINQRYIHFVLIAKFLVLAAFIYKVFIRIMAGLVGYKTRPQFFTIFFGDAYQSIGTEHKITSTGSSGRERRRKVTMWQTIAIYMLIDVQPNDMRLYPSLFHGHFRYILISYKCMFLYTWNYI